MERRHFIRTSGIFTAGIYASRAHAIAGPFKPEEIIHNIPTDKKLDPKWVRSLSQRGAVTRYRKSRNELRYIGMPVGGLFAGTVYLGGDGRLWLWDIFNENQNGIDPKTIEWGTDLHVGKKVRPQDGSAYVQPARDIRPLDQGFAFRIVVDGKTIMKRMDAADWDDIIFEATYPMARITYVDKDLPVDISVEVFSPFIPLDEKNSSLPCSIYDFKVSNKTSRDVTVEILGWLENKTSPRSAKPADSRINEYKERGCPHIQCSLQDGGDAEQKTLPDHGTMAISCFSAVAAYQTDLLDPGTDATFASTNRAKTSRSVSEQLKASVRDTVTLSKSSTGSSRFIFAWHFPNLQLNKEIKDSGRYYSNWFASASDVVAYVQQQQEMLVSKTRLWKQTFYDSTLPWWFLERTFGNTSILATTTAHRFTSGRFYAWEGVGCCEGTCMHVWQYAQAMGRMFPSLERDTRQRVDLGLSLQPDGMIWYRGEVVKTAAIDGQAGTILRIYREHQMSADDDFLRKNWMKIKLATQWVINQDRNGDGMEDTPVENTLDAVWDGEISWLVGLCIAAVKAGESMALEMGDAEFASKCADYVAKGRRNMEEKLFNGEYFIHRPDPIKGRMNLGSYNTCHIDQVYGQSWAFQVGLGRILDQGKTVSALKSLWKFNFTPDVGPYIKTHLGGRPYALPGEGGLVMNTNPKNEKKPYGENVTWQLGYFHECMSGFEHQVAAHMMAEGLIDESLVITRMIHDRYHAAKRNPFNEIECSDHYARAMASYGTFLSACGFEYHGPKGHIRFSPKISASNFKAPYTAAEGWGSYSQRSSAEFFEAEIYVAFGKLRLSRITVTHGRNTTKAKVSVAGKIIPVSVSMDGQECHLQLRESIVLDPTSSLTILI